jgi:hypothetical protein
MDDQTTIVVKALNLTWDEFCKQHAGASRAHADEIIRRLEAFGTAYFRISEIIRISPQSYRAILRGRPSQSVVCQSPQTAPPGRRRRRKTIACATRG